MGEAAVPAKVSQVAPGKQTGKLDSAPSFLPMRLRPCESKVPATSKPLEVAASPPTRLPAMIVSRGLAVPDETLTPPPAKKVIIGGALVPSPGAAGFFVTPPAPAFPAAEAEAAAGKIVADGRA